MTINGQNMLLLAVGCYQVVMPINGQNMSIPDIQVVRELTEIRRVDKLATICWVMRTLCEATGEVIE